MWSKLRTYGLNYINVIHPNAYVASPLNCVGSFFASGSHVGPNTTVGNFSIVNTRAILEHDCQLGEFSHMAPGSVTGGHVKISDLCMVGLGAMIRDNTSIGRKTTIGMGSVVTNNIGDNCVAYGNPAKAK
jgi:sugar O-acyltransferase (sialic acid O-acetyltransferase NeuD family)